MKTNAPMIRNLTVTQKQWRTEGRGVEVFKPPEIPKISVEFSIA